MPAPDRGFDEVRVLQRGDLEERVVDQRLEPVVGVAVVALGQVAEGERGDGRGVDAAETGSRIASASASTWARGAPIQARYAALTTCSAS